MNKTVQRALKILERRDHSEKELYDKLVEKGETEADARSAVDEMVSLGFVNDERYAPLIVRSYARKGYGASRIRTELYRRGIPREYWDEALAELPASTDTLDALVAERLRGETPDKKTLKKLTDSLMRRGFSWDEIRDALARSRVEEDID